MMFLKKTIFQLKTNTKAKILIIAFFAISISANFKIQAQDNKLTLKIVHELGEIRVADEKQIVTLNFKVKTADKIEDYPKNEITEKKITETTVTDTKSNAGEKLLVIFNKVRRTAQQGEESAKEYTDKSEGKKLLINGEKLLSYRKSQPDSGLIFPKYSIKPGDRWQINRVEQQKHFLEIYKNEILEVKFTWLKLDTTIDETGRIVVINRDLTRIGNQGELTITHKTKTLFYVDIKFSRIMRIESSGTIELTGLAKTGENVVASGTITEKISYSYAKTAMYLLQPKNLENCTQTEMTNVNIVIKLLVTPIAHPDTKFTMTEIHQTEKIIRRENLSVLDNKVKKYSIAFNRYRSSLKKQNSFNKEEYKRNKSALEGKTYVVEFDDANELIVQSDNTDEAKIVKTHESKDYQQQYPAFAVPIGYSWQITADKAKILFQELFADLTIESAVAQVDFEAIKKNENDEQIAILSLNFGVIGKNKDGLQIKLVVRMLNHFNIQKGRITKICTDPKLKDETLMKISFVDEKTIIEGYGSIEINTEYSYSVEKSPDTNETTESIEKILGSWEYADPEAKEPKKHVIQLEKNGDFVYKHPHLLRDEVITEKGTWVLKDNILTVILNEKTDVFEVTIEDNTMIVKRIQTTRNPSSIYPWILNSTARYVKTADKRVSD